MAGNIIMKYCANNNYHPPESAFVTSTLLDTNAVPSTSGQPASTALPAAGVSASSPINTASIPTSSTTISGTKSTTSIGLFPVSQTSSIAPTSSTASPGTPAPNAPSDPTISSITIVLICLCIIIIIFIGLIFCLSIIRRRLGLPRFMRGRFFRHKQNDRDEEKFNEVESVRGIQDMAEVKDLQNPRMVDLWLKAVETPQQLRNVGSFVAASEVSLPKKGEKGPSLDALIIAGWERNPSEGPDQDIWAQWIRIHSDEADGWSKFYRATLDTGTIPNWISPELIRECHLPTEEIAEHASYTSFVGCDFEAKRQARLRWQSRKSGKEKGSTTFFVSPEKVPVEIIFGKKFIMDEGFVMEIDGSHIFRTRRPPSAQTSIPPSLSPSEPMTTINE